MHLARPEDTRGALRHRRACRRAAVVVGALVVLGGAAVLGSRQGTLAALFDWQVVPNQAAREDLALG